MVLFTILALMFMGAAAIAIFAILIGGSAFIVVFSDIIVCGAILYLILKNCRKKKKK